MITKFVRYMKYLGFKHINDKIGSEEKKQIQRVPPSTRNVRSLLQQVFAQCNDFKIRTIILGDKVEILVAYMEGLSDKTIINDDILRPLMYKETKEMLEKFKHKTNLLDILVKKVLHTANLSTTSNFDDCVNDILSGNTVVFVGGLTDAIVIGTKEWNDRAIDEPDTESLIRGPREGFTESIRSNTALIRRKVKNANLKFEEITLGEQTNTTVSIAYIKGIVNTDVLETVKRRLNNIKTDAILESGYIEEFIEDGPLSLFPTIGNSERPDKVASKLLEGRVAILTDGTPFVLTVPFLFVESLQAAEDYYSRSFFTALIRLLRIFGLFIATLLPALYVATLSFHLSVVPFQLLISIAAGREGVPFDPFTESLVMLSAFEILREAGVRMPKPVGQVISIVGALILGQAAVDAGVVSNIMVIVIALTAISSFLVAPMHGAVPILRIIFLFSANILGYLGIQFVLITLLIHLCSLRSFGIPYLAPFAPLEGADLKDSLIRMPLWTLFTRPKSLDQNSSMKNPYRMKIDYRKKED